uniref:EamA domain-containing protein n=1 Tax=Phaeomonas parva TaxID=124430 RepID=A0A7S1UBW8_9STRA|mmetsp:Transcript_37980/g.119176  ORF Transcript_37980/g.119176 Transcript_37980/m.119176 type:complete len:289 (+) Transcript_37980:129-995(+)
MADDKDDMKAMPVDSSAGKGDRAESAVERAPFHAMMLAVLGYSACSGTMLVVNKVTMAFIPAPGAVVFIQLVAATLGVLGISAMAKDGSQKIEYSWKAQKAYLVYVFFFVISVYANMQALSHSNVDTVIVFRSCTPLAVAICDFVFMGRELPSMRSLGVLIALIFGAYYYALVDAEFLAHGIQAYFWCIVYFLAICVEMTLGKHITKTVKVSLSTSVFYTNAFSAIPMLLISLGTGESFSNFEIENVTAFFLLAISCVIGTAIGYTAWHARGMVSATTFTLVGARARP